MAKKGKLKIQEYIIYIGCGLFVLWGLVYIILGLLASNLPLPDSSNPLKGADDVIRNSFGLGFFGWGLILFGVFALVGAISLMVFAKDVDKNYEKNQRRAARLKRNTVEEEVVEAKVEEVK